MSNLRQAAQQALEALEQYVSKELTIGQRYTNEGQGLLDGIDHLRQALAEPEQEPVALTDAEILAANYPDGEDADPIIAAPDSDLTAFSRAVLAIQRDKEGRPMAYWKGLAEPEQEPSQAASDAYDRIDHFLRNNLGDEDYAEYSFDLELVWGAAPTPRKPLTQYEVVDAFCKHPHPAQFVVAFEQGVRFAEKHHGITNQETN